jgi:succinyl-CoA synthetase alpha subunit
VSILVDETSRVIVQGITGRDGAFHTSQMIAYGTKVVGGVTPGKGGQTTGDGVPIFNTMADAVAETAADTSVIYVPAAFATDAICEAADAGVKLVVCITEGVPVLDMVRVLPYLRERGARLIGPNCPGIISPGKCKVGIMPGAIHMRGNVGVVSRSGTLTYEIVHHLTLAGLGQSSCLGIGGDPVVGTNILDALELFALDGETEAVVLIGEIGGSDEEDAAAIIERGYPKKVAAFIAGQTAPPGKRMGHAGAIVSGGTGTAAEKIAAFKAAGVDVAAIPGEIVGLVKRLLGPGGAGARRTA